MIENITRYGKEKKGGCTCLSLTILWSNLNLNQVLFKILVVFGWECVRWVFEFHSSFVAKHCLTMLGTSMLQPHHRNVTS